MAIPTFTMRQMLEAGIHFGHHPRRWNPRMEPYLFGVRNNVHVINLEKTVPMLEGALKAVHDVVTKGGRVLFVGTKPQASAVIAEAASRCGQYYVNHRWLGGMMTNWKTVSRSIKRLGEYEEALNNPAVGRFLQPIALFALLGSSSVPAAERPQPPMRLHSLSAATK